MESVKIVIPGLTELDEEELRELLPEGVEFDRPETPEGSLAEPTTITAIIILAPLAITTLALWASKARRSFIRSERIKIIHPDGRVEERSLDVKASSEEEAKAGIAAELGKWLSEVQKSPTP